MAAIDDRLSRVINSIYDAALDPQAWQIVLREMSGLVHGNGACLFLVDRSLQPTGPFFSWELSPESLELYRDYYHEQDLRLQNGVPRFVDYVVTDHDVVDEQTIRNHEFYQDFLNRFDQPYVVAGLVRVDDLLGVCSCYRSATQGHAQRAEIALMKTLLPHLRRALRLQQQLEQLELERRAALEALQTLANAVLLVARGGRIVWLNGCAERLLQERDGISARRGMLTCATSGAGIRLSRLIETAAGARADVATIPGGTIVVSRPSTKRSYHVFVAPLLGPSARDRFRAGRTDLPVAIVFINDPEQTAPAAGMLARLHGLMPAEAKLAEAVAGGSSLKAYAEATERSLNYVRWLLKQIQTKTDTRSRADLVRVLVGQVAPLAMGDADRTNKIAPPPTR